MSTCYLRGGRSSRVERVAPAREGGAVNWGPARRSKNESDKAPRCVNVLHGCKKEGEMERDVDVGRVVVQAVDGGGAQLPKVELKVALRQAWID